MFSDIILSNINLLVIIVLSILFIVLIYFNRKTKKEQFNAYYKDKQKVGTNEMDRGNQPKSTWKNGNLNYESCYNTNTRSGNSIQRKNTFFCDFGNEGEIVPIKGTDSIDFINYHVYYQKIIKGKRLQGSHTVNGVSITLDEYGRPIGQIMTLQQSKETCDNLKDQCIGFIIQSNDNGNKNAATFFVAALEPGFEDPNVYDHIFVTPDERSREQTSLTSYQNYTSYIKKDVKYVEKPVKELNIPELCPEYNDAPVCPTGTLPCNENNRYCYFPDRDSMVSTYMVPQYDYCPSKNTGNKQNNNLPFKVSDTTVWFRQGQTDTQCSNLIAPAQCNWKDTSRCIFKDYTKSGDACVVNGNNNPTYSASGLRNYNREQLAGWLGELYNRNGGINNSRGEKANVRQYWNTCKNAPGYEFLQKQNFT
jgi:hypothetical protein